MALLQQSWSYRLHGLFLLRPAIFSSSTRRLNHNHNHNHNCNHNRNRSSHNHNHNSHSCALVSHFPSSLSPPSASCSLSSFSSSSSLSPSSSLSLSPSSSSLCSHSGKCGPVVESPPAPAVVAPSFQEAVQRLQSYWASVGCAVMQSSTTEVGAGTMNPATFLRVLGPEPWNVAYVEPSIRPDDSRYGDNPNRLQRHTQFQVILKPDPGNSQELYLGSLAALGIDVRAHDVRFVEDNWESPVLGAWGLGWEVWLDGMEITQFTYFQQAGSMPLLPVSVEITYGLERILMALQGVDHFKKIKYAPGITYGEMFFESEKEMSAFYLDFADVERLRDQFELYGKEANAMLTRGLAIPAYDYVLKSSHVFNILDARGAIGLTERARFFGHMRKLARQCAELWVKTRENLGHPLGCWKCPAEDEHPSEAIQVAIGKIVSPRNFVLEVGVEELPSQDVTSATEQLKESIQKLLEARRLKHGIVSVFGTPRRLVAIIENLEPKQVDIEKEIRGPPQSKAFDQEGQPTKALEGFCRKNNATVDETFVKTDGKTDYVYAVVKEQGKHIVEVLSEDLPCLLGGISFPKSMRWTSQFAFSRPVRWIVALHGDAVVPFSFAQVQSGRTTYLLRNSSTPSAQVQRAEDYIQCIETAGISLSAQDRRNAIWSVSNSLANSIGGIIAEETQGSLLDEVANLLEVPTPLLGSFDQSFLDLPPDVLITVMQKHQRYFPVKSQESRQLLPAFVAVANGSIDPSLVRRGNEAVLRARFEDAKFFYESDISKPLADFRPLLSGILFQEKLGSMLDKNNRICEMLADLGALLKFDESSINVALTAAPLMSADLSTSIITEFTSLAGIMGRHYALREGKPLAVAQAIYESVLPRHAGDVLPESNAGILLSIANRLDSLVGLFAVGCQPSSTADPYGLRRCASGLVQVLVENQRDLDLNSALNTTLSVQPVSVSTSIAVEVLRFVTRRLEQLLIDRGFNTEMVRAIIAERGNNPTLAATSVKQIEELSMGEEFRKVLMAYSRPAKIVRPELVDQLCEVDPNLFQEPQENALWIAYQSTTSLLKPGVGLDDFVKASLNLVQPLEEFFDNVFVLVEDKTLQRNRLSLLQKINDLPKGIVDISVLPGF